MGEKWGASISGDVVVCPKPRPPSRLLSVRRPAEISDSKAGIELLDLILIKGGYGAEKSNAQMAFSPPYFCGSPPSRASNPLSQDSQFRGNVSVPILTAPTSPSGLKSGSCARVSHKPAMVRVEGFDCLGRDRRSISAVA